MQIQKSKEGYKITKTNSGKSLEIPKEWVIDNIGKHVDILVGYPFSSSEYSDDKTDVRLLRGDNITKGKIRWGNRTRYWKDHSGFEKYLLRKSDFVIGMDGSKVGRNYAYIIEKDLPALLVQRVACLRAKQTLSQEYLGYLFGNQNFINYVESIKTNAAIPHISQKQIESFEILLPTKCEQQKIASILSKVDDFIQKTDEIIEQTRSFKKGLAQRLFSLGIDEAGKLRYEHTHEFQETQIGRVPKDWRLKPIEELASITTGDKDTQDKVENGKYPFFVRSQKVERIDSYSFDGEAILTAGDGVGVGKVFHYINGKFDFHQRVYLLSNFAPDILSQFLYEYFKKNFWKQVVRYSAKHSVDSVRRHMISRMLVPVPIIEEQGRIVKILSSIGILQEIHEKASAELQILRRGLMQKLLTGQIRVKV